MRRNAAKNKALMVRANKGSRSHHAGKQRLASTHHHSVAAAYDTKLHESFPPPHPSRISHSNGNVNPKNKRVCFPQRLFQMLDTIDQKECCEQQFTHIVSWHETGMGFVIHKPDTFASQVLPVFFRSQTKLPSFQRQLSNYGFERIRENNYSGSLTYCHRFFLRDDPGLSRNIVLKKRETLKKSQDVTTKTSDVIKRERRSLFLKTMLSQLFQSISRNDMLTKVVCDGDDSTLASVLPLPADNVLVQDEGDKILDEAVAEMIYCRFESRVRSQGRAPQGLSFCDGEENFSVDDRFWDPDAESITEDFVLGS